MIDQFLQDFETGHTEHQIDHYILDNEGVTVWGMYRQSLREMFGRISGCRNMIMEIRTAEIDLEENLHLAESLKSKNSFKSQRCGVKAWGIKMQLPLSRRKLDSKLKELSRFYARCEFYKNELGDRLVNDRQELEYEFWSEKFSREIAYRKLTRASVSPDILHHVDSLPNKYRDVPIGLLTGRINATEYTEMKRSPALDDTSLPQPSKKTLLEICHDPKFEQERGRVADSRNAQDSKPLEDRHSRRVAYPKIRGLRSTS